MTFVNSEAVIMPPALYRHSSSTANVHTHQVDQIDPGAAPGSSGETHPSAQDPGLHGGVGEQLSTRAVECEARPIAGDHGVLSAHQRMRLVRKVSQAVLIWHLT